MKIGIFGGSFDPVHKEHVKYAQAAIHALSLDKLLIVPSRIAPHKLFGAAASGQDRAELCKIAFSSLPEAEISDYELERKETSYSYLTCRHFAKEFPNAELFFLVGADMLEDFFSWKNPEEIIKDVTLVACGREEPLPEGLHKTFRARFLCDFLSIDHIGGAVSSTEIRVKLAFGKRSAEVPEEVLKEIQSRSLYEEPVIREALELEKPERREHSFRVALMACERAKGLKIPFHRALFAAALHDCGKYVPLDSPLLKGFVPPDAPEPVMHQYIGAYLAEHLFGIDDEEILSAIRYHTSGRRGMGTLEKLIYLSDALEEGRSYPNVEYLRKLFWEDLDLCLKTFLEEQLKYLHEKGQPIYFLTEEAYFWAKNS